MTLREFIDNISEWFGLNNTDQEVNEPQQYRITYLPPVIESPQELIDRWNMESRRSFPTPTSSINSPIGITGPVGIAGTQGIPMFTSTTSYYDTWSGTTYNYVTETHNLNPKPLEVYVKKMFPFIIGVDKIWRHEPAIMYDPTTFSQIKKTIFRVSLVLNPTHFSEVHSNLELKNVLIERLKKSLSQLINCMYEGVMEETIVFEFQPLKTETLLEDMNKLYYI